MVIRPYERIVFPLDNMSFTEAMSWAKRLRGRVGVLKVGLELFTRSGPEAVRMVRDFGFECFLDLKIHDIPRTAALAVEAAVRMGAGFVDIHASSGVAAMQAASLACLSDGDLKTSLLAVTLLTSLGTGAVDRIWPGSRPEQIVLGLAEMANDAGCHGLICSPQEVARLRARFGYALIIMTPGLRLPDSPQDDQKRIGFVSDAFASGANYGVIGTPIREASSPDAVLDQIAEDIAFALDEPGSVLCGGVARA